MKTITIFILVDAVGALASDTLDNNLYMLDDNKHNGSQNAGTGALKTAVKKGDQIMWSIMAIEPESFSSLTDIKINPKYCVPVRKMFPNSDVVFWEGTILQDLSAVPYTMEFHIGNPASDFLTSKQGPGFIKSNN